MSWNVKWAVLPTVIRDSIPSWGASSTEERCRDPWFNHILCREMWNELFYLPWSVIRPPPGGPPHLKKDAVIRDLTKFSVVRREMSCFTYRDPWFAPLLGGPPHLKKDAVIRDLTKFSVVKREMSCFTYRDPWLDPLLGGLLNWKKIPWSVI